MTDYIVRKPFVYQSSNGKKTILPAGTALKVESNGRVNGKPVSILTAVTPISKTDLDGRMLDEFINTALRGDYIEPAQEPQEPEVTIGFTHCLSCGQIDVPINTEGVCPECVNE